MTLSRIVTDTETPTSVGIGQCVITRSPAATLVAYGLGSCVGVAAWDAQAHVGGLIHILLPEPGAGTTVTAPLRYASTGVPQFLRELEQLGAVRTRMRVVAAGGANMLEQLATTTTPVSAIGARNIAMVCGTLQSNGVLLHAHDFGGNQGRTIGLVIATGEFWIRVAGSPAHGL